MEKIDSVFKKKIEERIALMGVKKEHVGKRIGLDKVRFSQTLAGKRNITPAELKSLEDYLNL